MEMSLYSISGELNEILENGFTFEFVNEDGDIDEEKVAERLNSLQVAFDVKVDNIASYIKSLAKLADDIKEERQSQYERETRIRKRIESLKGYLCGCMTAVGNRKVETARNCVSLSKSTRTEIERDILPDEWWRIKTEKEPDTTKIKSALKLGATIPGAELVTVENVRITGEKRKEA